VEAMDDLVIYVILRRFILVSVRNGGLEPPQCCADHAGRD
jgi:hypothetical protein